MADKTKIQSALFRAVDEINLQLAKDQRLEKKPQTALIGDTGKLDSLGLVNFIVAVEQEIEKEFGAAISITGEDPFSKPANPLQTLSSLTDFVGEILDRY